MRLTVQATQPAPLTAPAEARDAEPPGATLAQAHALVGRLIAQLNTLPRDIDMKREIGGEYSVHVMWSGDVSGVRALAAWTGTPWELVSSEFNAGVYAETRPVIDGVEVWAWTLLNPAEAADAKQLLAASQTTASAEAAADAEPTPVPVPLGESPAAQDETALYDESLTRYVASLGGSVVAQVPAVEASAVDDPSTIAFAPARPNTGGDL
jgi:hypothetical protein